MRNHDRGRHQDIVHRHIIKNIVRGREIGMFQDNMMIVEDRVVRVPDHAQNLHQHIIVVIMEIVQYLTIAGIEVVQLKRILAILIISSTQKLVLINVCNIFHRQSHLIQICHRS